MKICTSVQLTFNPPNTYYNSIGKPTGCEKLNGGPFEEIRANTMRSLALLLQHLLSWIKLQLASRNLSQQYPVYSFPTIYTLIPLSRVSTLGRQGYLYVRKINCLRLEIGGLG